MNKFPIIPAIIIFVVINLLIFLIVDINVSKNTIQGVIVDKHHIEKQYRQETYINNDGEVETTSYNEPEEHIVKIKTNEGILTKDSETLFYDKEIGDSVKYILSKGKYTNHI